MERGGGAQERGALDILTFDEVQREPEEPDHAADHDAEAVLERPRTGASSGHEVDFVLEWRRQLVAVEVKAGGHPLLKDARGMQVFLKEYPRRARGGIVLHGGSDTYWLDQRILAVPWWRVM